MTSISCFSQTESDSILIPRTELEEVFNAIDTLLEQDSIKTVLISDLKYQITQPPTRPTFHHSMIMIVIVMPIVMIMVILVMCDVVEPIYAGASIRVVTARRCH